MSKKERKEQIARVNTALAEFQAGTRTFSRAEIAELRRTAAIQHARRAKVKAAKSVSAAITTDLAKSKSHVGQWSRTSGSFESGKG